MARVGIISDTHGLLRPEVREILKTCQYIIHAGDIGSEALLDELRWMGRIFAVRGNCDGAWSEQLAKRLCFSIEGVGFFVVHDRTQVERNLGETQVVVCGHSHKYAEEMRDGRLWLNPGSCGVQRFGNALTMSLMTIENGNYEVEKLVIKEAV